jgi:ABC-2 type transport system ATP-binding protein
MIEISYLRKEYERTVALHNLQLHIPEGEVFGLIGPNGAGKTTLIRILATLLEPTYGHVRIGGVDVLEHPLDVHPLIGYMSDFFSLYDDLLVWEYLDHFARCYGVPRRERWRLIDEVLELVSLRVRRDAEVRALSRGMRQRLCFAKTLLHQPKVLLLDEPASGMDPAGRLEFRELIKKLKEMGRTVIISSHILTEMTSFCTSIGIMEQGHLIESGRVEDIVAKLQGGVRLEIEVLEGTAELGRLLQAHTQVTQVAVHNGQVTCRFGGSREQLPELHRQIALAGIPLVSFAARSDNLEDIYMRISGHRTS